MQHNNVNKSDFRSIFYQNLPHKPYCMDEIPGYMHIRPKEKALQKPYIQINPPCLVAHLVFDIDKEDAFFAWFDANLPQPNWISKNKENGHVHIGYMLSTPVCTTNNARQKIVRYLARIQHAYTHKLGADKGYVGLIAKNPLHSEWDNHILNTKAYELNYLADFVDLEPLPTKPTEVSGLGRNCTLFDIVRHWAYRAIKDLSDLTYDEWEAEVLSRASNVNTGFSAPLDYKEVGCTARSIAKWVWRNHGSAEFQQAFSEKQAKRGKKGALVANANAANQKGGKARSAQYSDMRKEALKMHIIGKSIKEISNLLSVHRNTVSNWLKDYQKSN
jgi:hypothetical protein